MKMYMKIMIAVIGVVVLLGGLGTIKGLQISRMVAQSESYAPPPQTVTAATVERSQWENTLTAVGTLEAVQGVVISAELAGKMTRIEFSSGARTEAGQLLIQQDVSEENARLRAAESRAKLARKELDRAKLLKKEKVATQSVLDDVQAQYEQAVAEVETIRAIIAKKTIRAPFAGRLGIRRVDLGEVLKPGQEMVSLQSLDPIYVNFQLPQQNLARLETGLRIHAQPTADGETSVEGSITAIDPGVDPDTRNVKIQATMENENERLRPGMFARVRILLPDKQPVLTVPATAVLYAPYSDSVFVVESQEDDAGQPIQVLRQQFVQLGEKRGDFVAIVRGLQAGQKIVSTGVFKLRNGMPVVIDNSLSPEFDLNPLPDNA